MGHEQTFATIHASEVAQVFRAQAAAGPKPGSIEEREALLDIDRARFEETNPPSVRTLRRRQRKHWSDREHALGH
jgi:hypothetical protein